MIKILFFAKLREDLGVDSLHVDVAHVKNIDELFVWLKLDKGFLLKEPVLNNEILIAHNHDMVKPPFDAFDLVDGDEIAFFPPVTGG